MIYELLCIVYEFGFRYLCERRLRIKPTSFDGRRETMLYRHSNIGVDSVDAGPVGVVFRRFWGQSFVSSRGQARPSMRAARADPGTIFFLE
jgi:hypothetical protein